MHEAPRLAGQRTVRPILLRTKSFFACYKPNLGESRAGISSPGGRCSGFHGSSGSLISAASTGGMDDKSCAGCGRPSDDHTNKELAACLGKVFGEFLDAYEKNMGA